MLQSVPKVAIAPLLLIWVGYGLSSRMIVAATVAFFPIVINTATGLEAADAELLDLTRSFDAGRLKVFWKVRLPWALPYLFSSLKVAITLAVIGAVVAEFVGADKGLGYLILTSAGNMQTALMFGALGAALAPRHALLLRRGLGREAALPLVSPVGRAEGGALRGGAGRNFPRPL